jgi:hypothetical protein
VLTSVIGKPHPRWVDNNGGFRGDDRRLGRSARGSLRHEDSRSNSSSSSDNHDGLSLEAVKTEQDPSHSPLYTMSPQFDAATANEPLSYFDIHRRTRDNYSPISPGITTNYSGSPFTDDSSSSYLGSRSSTHSLPFGTNGAAAPGLHLPPPQCGSNCTCTTNSSATPCLASLSHQLQSTLAMLRHLPEHAAIDMSCNVLRRISDLQATLKYVDGVSLVQVQQSNHNLQRQCSSAQRHAPLIQRIAHSHQCQSACKPFPRWPCTKW